MGRLGEAVPRVCGEVKPPEAFRGGWQCKKCYAAKRPRMTSEYQRNANLKHLYGITAEEFDRMEAAQGGACAICGKPETSVSRKLGRAFPLSVDHCHATGGVRGLLCRACNNGIGQLRHDPGLLSAAIEYLERTNATMRSER